MPQSDFAKAHRPHDAEGPPAALDLNPARVTFSEWVPAITIGEAPAIAGPAGGSLLGLH